MMLCSPVCQRFVSFIHIGAKFTAAWSASIVWHNPHALSGAGWVQCQLGRCWYEKVDYPQARLAFESARRREAHRLEVCTACLPASTCEIRGRTRTSPAKTAVCRR